MKTVTFLAVGMLIFSSQGAVSQIKLDDSNEQLQASAVNSLEEMRYYYYPNLETYFDTQKGVYLSCEKGTWVTSKFLNVNTRGYSLKNGNYKKLKGYTGDQPYTLLKEHKLLYPADYSTKPTRKLTAAEE